MRSATVAFSRLDVVSSKQQCPPSRILLLLPLSGSVGFAPSLIKLDDPLMRQFRVVAIGDGDAVLAGQHAPIACQQQAFGLGVFLLSRQAFAQQALGVVALPIVRLGSLLRFQRLTRQGFALPELPLREVGQREVVLLAGVLHREERELQTAEGAHFGYTIFSVRNEFRLNADRRFASGPTWRSLKLRRHVVWRERPGRQSADRRAVR